MSIMTTLVSVSSRIFLSKSVTTMPDGPATMPGLSALLSPGSTQHMPGSAGLASCLPQDGIGRALQQRERARAERRTEAGELDPRSGRQCFIHPLEQLDRLIRCWQALEPRIGLCNLLGFKV